MKRTYPANINGQIFYIDEDAFNLLNSYLEQLRQTFVGIEGQEIIGDIECRINELFNERLDAGANVIVLADVNSVIETMGRPEDLLRDEAEAETESDGSARRSNPPFISFNLPGRKHLYRNLQNKVFGGVFGGLASYLNWNAAIMRLLYLAAAVCTYFWPLTIIYLIAWMIIPPARTPRQILEMNGDPINVDTVGQAVMATQPTPPPYSEPTADGGFWNTLFNIIGKVLMGILGMLSGIICFGALVSFMCICASMVTFAINHTSPIFTGLSITPSWTILTFGTCISLLAIIISGSLTWGASTVVLGSRGMSRSTVISIMVISTMLLFVSIILGSLISSAAL